MSEFKVPKKLIEVALPLDAINAACGREKSIRHGHPSSLHIWWARRPLAAARAIIFAQMVNDPGYERQLGRGANKDLAIKERKRLFGIIERLVTWENTGNLDVIREAREEIWKSWRETCALNKDHPSAKELFNPERLPSFHDPFAGGGALPLEALRLGLKAFGSDLNPIPVLINKAMLEVPGRFRQHAPISSFHTNTKQSLLGNVESHSSFADDLRFYGKKLKDRVSAKTAHLYSDIKITSEMAKDRPELRAYVGKELKPLAYIWARTVRSPNPAFGDAHVPLVSSFVLATKEGKETYIKPIVSGNSFRFKVVRGPIPSDAEEGTKAARGAHFTCLLSRTPISPDYIREQFVSHRDSVCLMAIVAEGKSERVYLDPIPELEQVALNVKAPWRPEIRMNQKSKDLVSGRGYGIETWDQIYTERQLVLLDALTQSVQELIDIVHSDAKRSQVFPLDDKSFSDGGRGSLAYAQAIGLYLGLATSKFADNNSTACTWMPGVKYEVVRNTFSRQALPMTWDFAEPNPFAGSSGDFLQQVERMATVYETSLCIPGLDVGSASVSQENATELSLNEKKVFSTDPPYYDNIAYADLSDFFYIWLKKALKDSFPNELKSDETPKEEELVALSYRHESKEQAEQFFLSMMSRALICIRDSAHPAFPVTIYYAFKQAEIEESGVASSGWNTFLSAVLQAGYQISATWPLRTERSARTVSIGTNTLASSVVLACRMRPKDAPSISRREFVRELNSVLPVALEEMTTGGDHSPVAPVDLSQAIIGPGMAIFSKYSAVLEADGRPMSVKTALQLINRFIAEDDFDHDTQFCLQWFETNGWQSGKYGGAEVLARAKGTSVDGLKNAGVIESAAGTVRLFKPSELSPDWRPEFDSRVSIWELLHNMILAFSSSGSSGAGQILARANQFNETIRTLAYRLYTICERKGWAQDAGHYDSLVRAWDSIESEARGVGYSGTQIALFDSAPTSNESQNPTKAKSRKRK